MRLRPPSLLRSSHRLAVAALYVALYVTICTTVCAAARAVEATPALACAETPAHWPRAVQALVPISGAAWPAPDAARGEMTRHFGGISGIDFDPRSGRWWLLSDDRSEQAPARFYEATMEPGGTPRIEAVHTLRRADGAPFARYGSADGEPADGEALRADPCGDALWWASEADPPRGFPAAVHRSTRDGHHAGTVALPANLQSPRDGLRGPRPNRSIEGLAFVPDGSALWIAREAPLAEDGPLPTREAGAALRFTRLARDGRAQQYAYPLEPLPREGRGGQRRADNGVSEILAIGADTLLVVERAGHEVDDGVFAFAVRLYVAEVAGADDVSTWPTLAGRAPVPMRKRLLLDLAGPAAAPGLGAIDNIEAAAWGPRLPDGRATLLLASDDNFSPRQATQWLWFAVVEK
jgi:hypothetical protein